MPRNQERNLFLLLTLLSQIYLTPKHSGKHNFTSPTSLLSLWITRWGREEGKQVPGIKSFLMKNWCLEKLNNSPESHGYQMQRSKFLESSSLPTHYTTLTNPLIIEWSKLQIVESSKTTMMFYMALWSHFNHVKNNYRLIKHSWLCKSFFNFLITWHNWH